MNFSIKKTAFAIRLSTKCILMLGSDESSKAVWENSKEYPEIIRIDVRGYLTKAWNYITKKEIPNEN